jgi:high-affinity K+ transport system ATPase subunit B
MSGIDLRDRRQVRKGAVGAVKNWVKAQGGTIPANLDEEAKEMKGVAYKSMSSKALLGRNQTIYGLGGVLVPFIGIKLTDMAVSLFL